MKAFIQPYKLESEGASALAKALGIRRIRDVDSAYVPKPDHVILNWGNSKKYYPNVKYLNLPSKVDIACDKLKTFQKFDGNESGVMFPVFTTSRGTAQAWWDAERTVIARKLLRASEGEGITVIRPGEPFPDTSFPLYTLYVRKMKEYRVHVFQGVVIDVTEKRRKKDFVGDTIPELRNYKYGWVFCHDDVEPHPNVTRQAKLAVKLLGLDFGAVDVIWNEHKEKAFVLEVNTAPGIEGQTLEKYTQAISTYLQKLEQTWNSNTNGASS